MLHVILLLALTHLVAALADGQVNKVRRISDGLICVMKRVSLDGLSDEDRVCAPASFHTSLVAAEDSAESIRRA